jgi:hypothetical protein
LPVTELLGIDEVHPDAGTVATGELQSEGQQHWTFGCWGTAGFLRTVLRAANVPCTLAIACTGPQ